MEWSRLVPEKVRPLVRRVVRQFQFWTWRARTRIFRPPPWEGNHHPSLLRIEPWKGEVSGNYSVDFLGVRTDPKFRGHFNPSPKGFLETAYPEPDQSYFEYIFLLESIASATGPIYTILELGAGYGYWLVSASEAVRIRSDLSPCLVGVEMEAARYRWMLEHFKNNGLDPGDHHLLQAAVSDHDGMSSYQAEEHEGEDYGLSLSKMSSSNRSVQVPCTRLGPILDLHAQVDLLHMDIQGEELRVIQDARSEINDKVGHLVIGTHSGSIHRRIRALLLADGWSIRFDYSGKSHHRTDFGKILFVDGVLAADNLKTRPDPPTCRGT